jgi:hypothetical protein
MEARDLAKKGSARRQREYAERTPIKPLGKWSRAVVINKRNGEEWNRTGCTKRINCRYRAL